MDYFDESYEDNFDLEFNGSIIRHTSNGEESVNIYRKDNGDVMSDDDECSEYIGNINDEDIEDKIDEFEFGWRETHWNRSDWADHYGVDEEDLDDAIDDDMRDYD
jgi:hypothetical protein